MNADINPMTIVLAHEAAFCLGGLCVRPSTREVVDGETRDVLEPRVMQVLVALARASGEVVSRDDLTLRCWGGRVVGEDAINRVIARIRRLSERDEARHFTLETVRKVGYRLLPATPAHVRPEAMHPMQFHVPGDGRSHGPAIPLVPRRSWPRWRLVAILSALTLLVLLSATAFALTWRSALMPDAVATDADRVQEALGQGGTARRSSILAPGDAGT